MNIVLTAKQVEKISKALADPYRLQIMDLVNKDKEWVKCVSIIECINLAQSTISHHISQLVEAELLIAEKDGRNVKYVINQEVLSGYIAYLNHFKS
jgi:ArsR family transcriptional regulator